MRFGEKSKLLPPEGFYPAEECHENYYRWNAQEGSLPRNHQAQGCQVPLRAVDRIKTVM